MIILPSLILSAEETFMLRIFIERNIMQQTKQEMNSSIRVKYKLKLWHFPFLYNFSILTKWEVVGGGG